jgi:hypothetical protein
MITFDQTRFANDRREADARVFPPIERRAQHAAQSAELLRLGKPAATNAYAISALTQ